MDGQRSYRAGMGANVRRFVRWLLPTQGIRSEKLRTGCGLTRRLRAADAAAAAADDAVAADALHEQKKVASREAARKRRSRAADAAAAPADDMAHGGRSSRAEQGGASRG